MKNISYITILISVGLLFASCKQERKLPFYGERHAETVKDAAGVEKIDTVYQTIPAWSFLNQDSIVTTNKSTDGKVYVADFFFTSCTTICPTMHRNLMTVYNDFKSNPDVMFVSHTIDFKYDKPHVLKKYAQKLGVDGPKWQFLYGTKDSVYTLAEKNYLVAVGEDSTAKDGYIHQGYLVLIDKDRRIRGAYDGTKEDQVEQLKKDIPVLLAEYKK
ncbi:SCO family protein [Pedobacter alluvionis]|uniref:Protein SCO1/2 n=1 Tax=Pedobacter alluvionis TaxID=475253 RepID=A0A497Y001_9SPHI|nr:SCO family protein [Pedobacter alluvionis]RLJ74905.1 protein SCO1/2 [Pedobacter alluvionis]TFB30029.1 SCO family protein [Pedobacter alluvionis]